MIGLTVCIHAVVLDRLMLVLEWFGPISSRMFNSFWKVPVLVLTVLGVFSAHIVEIWLWAGLYIITGALDHFETALYFSTTVFTTLGLGDIVLGEKWRLLSVIEAANGFMLFGWSTAFIFEIMSKLYKKDTILGGK